MTQPKSSKLTPETDLFPDDAAPSDGPSTRAAYLDRSRSGYTKIRHAFVQQPPTTKRSGSRPAMLPSFARNHRAAVLYLAVLTNWTWLNRSGEALPADTWIRFLSSTKPGALTWTPQSLSHAWKVLEDNKLVSRTPDNRLRKVTPLRESGDGEAYTRPEGSSDGIYFVLPHEFWTLELHATLSWPALAVLLILLKESGGRPWAELAVDRAQKYYGISRTTTEEGLTELRNGGLLVSRTRYVVDHDAAEGRRQTSLHVLNEPFSMQYRQSLQKEAQRRQKAKGSAAKMPKKKKKAKEVSGDEKPEARA